MSVQLSYKENLNEKCPKSRIVVRVVHGKLSPNSHHHESAEGQRRSKTLNKDRLENSLREVLNEDHRGKRDSHKIGKRASSRGDNSEKYQLDPSEELSRKDGTELRMKRLSRYELDDNLAESQEGKDKDQITNDAEVEARKESKIKDKPSDRDRSRELDSSPERKKGCFSWFKRIFRKKKKDKNDETDKKVKQDKKREKEEKKRAKKEKKEEKEKAKKEKKKEKEEAKKEKKKEKEEAKKEKKTEKKTKKEAKNLKD